MNPQVTKLYTLINVFKSLQTVEYNCHRDKFIVPLLRSFFHNILKVFRNYKFSVKITNIFNELKLLTNFNKLRNEKKMNIFVKK